MLNNIVTQEAINHCLGYIDESKKDQFLELMAVTQIMLDDPTFEDSIAGTSIRASYITTITRKGKGQLKFQCVSEMSVDFSKIPIDFAINRGDKDDPIIESYNILQKHKPTLHDILGVLKRNYFMPRDFSDKLMIDHIYNLSKIFTKDEILTLPSI
ncbi:MAG TPA: hypothetical protein VFM18_20335, partial [Methanosarcina sp.]|nr:hypothetical protein [Methanosarcina sp.]